MRPRSLAALGAALLAAAIVPVAAGAQSPELAMREFASGQVKKGVRSIGFGGDGATWGNYALVYRDAGSALVDYGRTAYTNGNVFSFTAVGVTTPDLWNGLAVYAIGLAERATDVAVDLHVPGLGPGAAPFRGDGADQALFVKAAMPVGHGVSVGVLLSYETSQFAAIPAGGEPGYVSYRTSWRPSGGFGVTWQPDERVLLGVRALFNNDWETRTDPTGLSEGLARSYEFRIGGSVSPWKGGIADLGMTVLDRSNAIAGTRSVMVGPNLGIEQNLLDGHLALRGGLDEKSATAGLSVRFSPVSLDAAFVHDMAISRVGPLFGTTNDAVLMTFTFDYQRFLAGSGAPAR
ncbi:MAG TPA: hypothetical protein VFM53_15580 [Anaeromyxobacteraceae bacterium]|nr:hypothetical protein [Anaeromyxobacteraceae bacterium]